MGLTKQERVLYYHGKLICSYLDLTGVKIRYKVESMVGGSGEALEYSDGTFTVVLKGTSMIRPQTMIKTIAHEVYHIYATVHKLKNTESAAKKFEKIWWRVYSAGEHPAEEEITKLL
jgi:hypothetical protein